MTSVMQIGGMLYGMGASTAVHRYVLLIRQLGEEVGFRGNWQTEVGKRLGIGQSQVSRILSGQRNAGRRTIDTAVERLSIRPDFFFGRFPHDPHYRDFVGIDKNRTKHSAHQALVDFLKSHEGISTTNEERVWLSMQRWPGEPTVLSYHYLINAIRSVVRASESDQADAGLVNEDKH